MCPHDQKWKGQQCNVLIGGAGPRLFIHKCDRDSQWALKPDMWGGGLQPLQACYPPSDKIMLEGAITIPPSTKGHEGLGPSSSF